MSLNFKDYFYQQVSLISTTSHAMKFRILKWPMKCHRRLFKNETFWMGAFLDWAVNWTWVHNRLFKIIRVHKSMKFKSLGISKLTDCFSPAGNYLLKVKNWNTRTRYEICSKLTIKTPERRHWLYCWLWTYFTPCSSVSIVNFEQVNAGWEGSKIF